MTHLFHKNSCRNSKIGSSKPLTNLEDNTNEKNMELTVLKKSTLLSDQPMLIKKNYLS